MASTNEKSSRVIDIGIGDKQRKEIADGLAHLLADGLVMAALVAARFRLVFDIVSLRVEGCSTGALQAAVTDRVLRLPDHLQYVR